MKKYIHKIRKNNNYSYSITIPKELIDKYGWRSKQKLVIKDRGRGVLEIKDWRNK
jgi:bifunctional DNA-binding transcriptional regulator/antitoxin component of YhaV-PrlF toxin-antitoxin module